jgi:hypothetical protein
MLYDMLEDTSKYDEKKAIVSWMPHRRAFKVHNPADFESKIMPNYFRERYSSFKYLLERWGFHRFSRGKDRGAYYHTDFIRGQRERIENATKAYMLGAMPEYLSPKDEPNFYEDSRTTISKQSPDAKDGPKRKAESRSNDAPDDAISSSENVSKKAKTVQTAKPNATSAKGKAEPEADSLIEDSSKETPIPRRDSKRRSLGRDSPKVSKAWSESSIPLKNPGKDELLPASSPPTQEPTRKTAEKSIITTRRQKINFNSISNPFVEKRPNLKRAAILGFTDKKPTTTTSRGVSRDFNDKKKPFVLKRPSLERSSSTERKDLGNLGRRIIHKPAIDLYANLSEEEASRKRLLAAAPLCRYYLPPIV